MVRIPKPSASPGPDAGQQPRIYLAQQCCGDRSGDPRFHGSACCLICHLRPWLMEPHQNSHSGRDTQADVLPLPIDAVNEILLRLPAKDLCRLRAVSRSWRSHLSDHKFIAYHTPRHPDPLIVAGYNTTHREDHILCDIWDLSGHAVKRVHATGGKNEDERVMNTQSDLLLERTNISMKLLNPATGVVYALPERLAEEHAVHHRDLYNNYCYTATFGKVASTGVYKVLRVVVTLDNGLVEHLYEVFTLDGSSHAQWRPKQAPPYQVELDNQDSVVINGIAYFFSSDHVDDGRCHIASFNFETEEWSTSIPGPPVTLEDDDTSDSDDHIEWWFQFTAGSLSGSLVMACRPLVSSTPSSMDLWFLVDFEKGLWVKQYSIELSFRYPAYSINSFLVLNDERIVIVIDTINRGLVRIYNPGTKTSTEVMEMGYGVAIGLYTGNLLTLNNENTTGFAEGP